LSDALSLEKNLLLRIASLNAEDVVILQNFDFANFISVALMSKYSDFGQTQQPNVYYDDKNSLLLNSHYFTVFTVLKCRYKEQTSRFLPSGTPPEQKK